MLFFQEKNKNQDFFPNDFLLFQLKPVFYEKKLYLCGGENPTVCSANYVGYIYFIKVSKKMPVKIRLQRHGRKKAPFYHIVAADSRSPRDGKFIEKLGSYNPLTKPATIEIDRDKAFDWLEKGAQPTDTVRAILRFKGVMYRTHLMRGVKKGALTVEQAEVKLAQWIEAKETHIETRRQQSATEKQAFHIAVSGKPKERKAKAAADAPAAE